MEIRVSHDYKSLFVEIYIALASVGAIFSFTFMKLPVVAALLAGSALIVAFFYYEISESDLLFAVDEGGIYDARLGIGKIMWRDVAHVEIELYYRTRFLCLRMKNPEKLLHRLPPKMRYKMVENHKLGFTSLNIDLSGLDLNPLMLKKFAESNIA